jgi:hypothetical protein
MICLAICGLLCQAKRGRNQCECRSISAVGGFTLLLEIRIYLLPNDRLSCVNSVWHLYAVVVCMNIKISHY